MKDSIYVGVIFFSIMIIITYAIVALGWIFQLLQITVSEHIARIIGSIVLVGIGSVVVSGIWYGSHKND